MTGIIKFCGLSALFASLAFTSQAADIDQYTQAAAKTTQTLLKQLGSAMKQEMKTGGPVAAVKVCAEIAPQIAGELSRQNGWKITRVGTRVRNPMLGMADSWEQQILTQFQQRSEQGETYATMTHAGIVTEPDGRYFRFMKAIKTKQACLTCHGSENSIPTKVKNILDEKYPHDQATGYKKGDLRGAVSIKWKL